MKDCQKKPSGGLINLTGSLFYFMPRIKRIQNINDQNTEFKEQEVNNNPGETVTITKGELEGILSDLKELKEANRTLKESKKPYHLRKKEPIVYTVRLKKVYLEEKEYLIIGWNDKPVKEEVIAGQEPVHIYKLHLMDTEGEIIKQNFSLLKWHSEGTHIHCKILERKKEEIELFIGYTPSGGEFTDKDAKAGKPMYTVTNREKLTLQLPEKYIDGDTEKPLNFKIKTLTIDAKYANAY